MPENHIRRTAARPPRDSHNSAPEKSVFCCWILSDIRRKWGVVSDVSSNYAALIEVEETDSVVHGIDESVPTAISPQLVGSEGTGQRISTGLQVTMTMRSGQLEMSHEAIEKDPKNVQTPYFTLPLASSSDYSSSLSASYCLMWSVVGWHTLQADSSQLSRPSKVQQDSNLLLGTGEVEPGAGPCE
jgi:hypothetical protein